MARVVPGVEFKVEFEVVPRSLYPAGVIAMIGTAAKGDLGVPKTVTSYKELVEIFGPESSEYTLVKDGKMAFLNSAYQLVAIRVASSLGSRASAIFKGKRKVDAVKISAKNTGTDGNGIKVVVLAGKSENTVRIEISGDNIQPETFDDLVMNKDSDNYLVNVLNSNSKFVMVETLIPDPNPDAHNPTAAEETLTGGSNASLSPKDYENALALLESEEYVEFVMACGEARPEVHALIDAHCEKMSLGKEPNALSPRIGIGTVGQNESVDQIVSRTSTLASDRFVLVAPFGFAAAVGGLLSKLDYYESPTFKAISGISEFGRRYTPSEQMKLVSNGILTLDSIRGRGIVILKGITTSRDVQQLSVKRIANRAVMEVKNIADGFIGRLNNYSARLALKERITESMIRMERDGAIVPSTDMTKPSFLVDVYSTQDDFAQGRVNADIAVRPVRAIDYIYGTVSIQAY